ncbi:MAG TPA: phosphatidate cytidylyltransferase [Bryobacteraceae bacterium]|nr:phosphatidate cytidylyltransferase [Bryobacteraceae bacterium]
MKRILTALVLGPLSIYVVLWGPNWSFFAVLAAVALLCFREYSGIVAAYGIERPGPVAYAAGLLLLAWPHDAALPLTLIALGALCLNFTTVDFAKGLPRAAAFVLGVIYIFAAWRTAVFLRAQNAHWLMFALAVNWLGDSAAYYIGRKLGRHKLAPRISPGKSWEGSVASLAVSVGFAVLYLTRAIPAVSVLQAASLGVAANVAGQIGDLAESALKRGAGVKDSGNMLPGHGGWLDRVDSILFALPVVYALLASMGF